MADHHHHRPDIVNICDHDHHRYMFIVHHTTIDAIVIFVAIVFVVGVVVAVAVVVVDHSNFSLNKSKKKKINTKYETNVISHYGRLGRSMQCTRQTKIPTQKKRWRMIERTKEKKILSLCSGVRISDLVSVLVWVCKCECVRVCVAFRIFWTFFLFCLFILQLMKHVKIFRGQQPDGWK